MPKTRRAWLWAAALLGLFVFRLAYGLTRQFFAEDESQIFLIGLRYYATGHWPFFGPDIVWTGSEVPGALIGLAVGLPLKVAAIPEVPFILLNVLSMAALSAFAWYITARIPTIPKWLVWGWLMTLPWTIEFSTHVVNPSYLLAASLVFFLGFFEAVPVFRLGKIPVPLAFAMMGAATTWAMQVHMSWPLLVPYVGVAWISRLGDPERVALQRRDGVGRAILNTVAFFGGALLIGSLIIPTYVTFAGEGHGGIFKNLRPHWVGPSVAVSVLARLFSFASLEVWRFLTTDDPRRQMFLLRNLWIAPLALIAWIAGLWQPIWMLREWLRTRSPFAEWRTLKWLVAGTVAVVYLGYCFVLEPSQAHAFYVLAPVGFMFTAYCWTFVDSRRWRRVAAALLAVNVLFHIGQAWIQAPERSLYRNRELVATAIQLKQPEMFGHRRATAIDAGPAALNPAVAAYDPRRDIELLDVRVTLAPRRVALWTVTLRNRNDRVAYRDIHYELHYRNREGGEVRRHIDYLEDVFQPGSTTKVEIVDGFVDPPFETTTIDVFSADAILALPQS